jgi:hypothetical protein
MARFHDRLDDLDGMVKFDVRPTNKPNLDKIGLARELTANQCNGVLRIGDFDDSRIGGL